MVNTDQLLHIISDETLTHKDKIVFIAVEILETNNPKSISDYTKMSIASIRQSLAKSVNQLLDTERESEKVIDALIAVCSIDQQSMRQKDWSAISKIAISLTEAGATAEEVHSRANQYRRKFSTMALTPAALDKYWPMLSTKAKFSPSSIYN